MGKIFYVTNYFTISSMSYTKYTISLFSILFIFSCYAQDYGNLMVKAFKNTSLNLSDNFQLDTIRVRIINQMTLEEKTVIFTPDIQKRPLLTPGKYKLICSVHGENDRIVEDVIINTEKITFVELLYEPKQRLSCSQKRKRKKLQLIYD